MSLEAIKECSECRQGLIVKWHECRAGCSINIFICLTHRYEYQILSIKPLWQLIDSFFTAFYDFLPPLRTRYITTNFFQTFMTQFSFLKIDFELIETHESFAWRSFFKHVSHPRAWMQLKGKNRGRKHLNYRKHNDGCERILSSAYGKLLVERTKAIHMMYENLFSRLLRFEKNIKESFIGCFRIFEISLDGNFFFTESAVMLKGHTQGSYTYTKFLKNFPIKPILKILLLLKSLR